MNIFEYIDKKRNEYEMLRDENQLQYKTNCNRIQKIASQIKHMTEEEENPSQFFLPETGNYKEEIEKQQGKIDALESENTILSEKIELCEEELRILDTLELPDFVTAEKNMAWEPMRVPEEEFQKNNISRETMEETNILAELDDLIQNVSRETNSEDLSQDTLHETNLEESLQNVSRETFSETVYSVEESAEGIQEIIDRKQIKEKICFCRKFSELDPRRCSLLLDEIINEL